MSLPAFDHLLVVPHLRVQNANAISSPLTHGFPAITAFLGLMWALERKTHAAGLDVQFSAVGVICHDHQELVNDDPFAKTFRLTRNPLDKSGSTAAIVEEGRIHLDISLVFAVYSASWEYKQRDKEADKKIMINCLNNLRIAGGSFVHAHQAGGQGHRSQLLEYGNEEQRRQTFRTLRRLLLPGSALVARDDLLAERLQTLQRENPAASALDALLSLSRINWHYQPQEGADNNNKGQWQSDRVKGSGWVVPIPVGYGALSELYASGTVANSRDNSTPFRFVESLYSMGEWIGPHRLNTAEQLLWYADNQPENGLYRCRNDFIQPTND